MRNWTYISLTGLFMMACFAPGCAAPRAGRDLQLAEPQNRTSLKSAVRRTMAEARAVIDEFGVKEPAMLRIQAALARLASEPGLTEAYPLRKLHGGGASVVMLATEGDEGLTLTLARFEPGEGTPVHDHGTWAVAHVIKGRDQYIQWERIDDGSNPEQARLRVKHERVLGPGDSVYWLDPPHDIHSQKSLGQAAWELVLFGRNPLRSERQYFDPDTGEVTRMMPR